MEHKTQNSGFTLLMAVLIASIIMGISFGFSVFVIRELDISILGRESQEAVFASDSGAECVFYWEFAHEGLAQSAFATTTSSVISCAGNHYTVGGAGVSGPFTLHFDNGACADVTVDKVSSYPLTIVESKGHNVCAAGSPSRVERAFRITY